VFSGGYLLKASPERDVDLTLPKEIEPFVRPRDLGNIRGKTVMSPRPAYHKLYWIHAPEYLFGLQISDAGQFFYESMNPAFERLLGISLEGSERAIHDCMSEEDAKSICASCNACLERDEFRFGHNRRWRSNWRIRPVRRC
jgi:hypothetical protein